MNDLKRIHVIPVGGLYHAELEDHPDIWASGSTAEAALGNLIATHRNTFAIEVIRPMAGSLGESPVAQGLG
jgi:hypothetical protein